MNILCSIFAKNHQTKKYYIGVARVPRIDNKGEISI